ncbi:MAG: ABC transporter ATP-binding protein [Actinomycetota bacterium]
MTAVAPALELRDITAGYGRLQALHGVSLSVASGTVFALLGPNGAGKSTALQVASGDIRPSSGCLHVAGAHINGTSPERLARAGVCLIPEGRGIFPNLTVAENLRMATFAGDLDPSTVEEQAFARFPQLANRREQLAGTLSGGEQQMLAMSRALVTDPDVLLLDEISMGLAPLIVSELYLLVAQLAADGISILLVEQFAHTALGVADQVAVMAQGRIVASGTPAEVSDLVSEAYLGGVA